MSGVMQAVIDTMAVALAERGLVPLAGLRVGVRRVIERRLHTLAALDPSSLTGA